MQSYENRQRNIITGARNVQIQFTNKYNDQEIHCTIMGARKLQVRFIIIQSHVRGNRCSKVDEVLFVTVTVKLFVNFVRCIIFFIFSVDNIHVCNINM